MEKQRIVREDGRYVLLYTFRSADKTATAAGQSSQAGAAQDAKGAGASGREAKGAER